MSNDRKIAFVCHPYHRGGVTRWMADAAIAYAEKGWLVYFVTVEPVVTFFSGAGRETMLYLLQTTPSPVHIISERVGWEFELGTVEYRAYIYKRLLLKVPVGTPVILSDDATVWVAAAFLYKTYPLVGVLHADHQNYYSLAEKYFRQVALFVSVSARVSRLTLQLVPQISPGSMCTIPCGIHLPKTELVARDGAILKLIYVGRVTEHQKRVSDLVKVCNALNRQNVRFHLDIIGDGSDRSILEVKFKDAGLGSLVTFHGWQEQSKVSGHLAASDILLLTSDFEGTPIAMMEALAVGCSVVGTRVSGIEDYEQHPQAPDCFAIFDVGDIDAAVVKIYQIVTIPLRTRQIAARKLAVEEFSLNVCLDRYTLAINNIKNDITTPPRVTFSLAKRIFSKVIAIPRYLKLSLSSRKQKNLCLSQRFQNIV